MKIAQIVDQKKPALGEKGQYGYVRKPEEKPKRSRRKRNSNDADMDSAMAGPSMHTLDAYSVPMPVPLPALTGVIGSVGGPNDAFNAVMYPAPLPMFQQMSVPVTGHLDAATARSQAREEEMEDDDEWQIREASASPTVWAKRKFDEEEGSNKRARSRFVIPSCPRFNLLISGYSSSPPKVITVVPPAPLHPIDQAVQDIAREFRFTSEEVQEYYDRCGDPERTRNRFTKMRDVLNALKDDNDELVIVGPGPSAPGPPMSAPAPPVT